MEFVTKATFDAFRDETNAHIFGVKGDVAGLKEDVSILKEDISILKEDVACLKEDVTGIKEDITCMRDDLASFKQDVFDELHGFREILETIRKYGPVRYEIVDTSNITYGWI